MRRMCGGEGRYGMVMCRVDMSPRLHTTINHHLWQKIMPQKFKNHGDFISYYENKRIQINI